MEATVTCTMTCIMVKLIEIVHMDMANKMMNFSMIQSTSVTGNSNLCDIDAIQLESCHTSVNPSLTGKSLKCDINDICYMM